MLKSNYFEILWKDYSWKVEENFICKIKNKDINKIIKEIFK